MEDQDWLVLVDADGTVTGVEGGAPTRWIGRPIDACTGMPDAARSAAHAVVRKLDERLGASPIHRVRLPATPDRPGYSIIAVEGVLLSYSDVELAPLIRRALAPIVLQADRARIEFTLECKDLRRVWVDEGKFGWALSTLAGNALRHLNDRFPEGASGGRIAVEATRHPGEHRVRVDVSDNGPGIPEHLRAWLVEPDPTTGRATGLGLRLVNDVVRAHGGHMVVKASTTDEDRGTTVSLWLPTRT